jgi:hypothetical protein
MNSLILELNTAAEGASPITIYIYTTFVRPHGKEKEANLDKWEEILKIKLTINLF